ncbi:MAG: hypothetical protein RL264_2158 [Bacteroidota bacterium]|jgi:antitoxin component YwqK of YwqJK toxin-antitoxin module
MKNVLAFIAIVKIGISISQTNSPKPCYQEKRICNYKLLTNCNDLVAFDERSHTYISKKDFATPFTGRCASCYRTGQLQESIIVVNGKRDSIGTAYFESGCIQSKQTFVLGKLNGKSTFYYDSTGRKEIEVSHFLDKLDGVYILFENNPTNDTLKLITYKNNVYNGVQKEYYDNNKLAKIVNYKDAILHGIYRTYNYEGKIEMDMNYSEGKKNGTWKFYYPDGKEARIENWSMGIKNGEFRTNNEKGEILSQEFYKKNVPDGKFILNYANGKPKHITFYEEGKIVEEHEFEELTGAKHTIKERELTKKELKKNKKEVPVPVDDDPDDLLGEKAAKAEQERLQKEAEANKKKKKKN